MTPMQPEYTTADIFRYRCLTGNGSYLFPSDTVWTEANLQSVIDAVEESPDEAGGDTFMDKLRYQLQPLSLECSKLAADALIVYYLFPANDIVKADTKRERVSAILSWKNIPKPEQLTETFANGIGGIGTHYLAAQNSIFKGILKFALSGKRSHVNFKSQQQCDELLTFLRQNDKIPIELPHALLHLMFPEDYEPIVSERHKRAILRRYAPELSDAENVNTALRSLRPKLESQLGKGFSYYSPAIRAEWDTDSKIANPTQLPLARDIFVAPASGSGVTSQRLLYSVAYPINRVNVDQFMPQEKAARIARLSGNGQFYAWATQDTPILRGHWEKMKPGDAVLFYGNGSYNYVAFVIDTLDSSDLADELWTVGTDSGRGFSLIYFLTQPRSIATPLNVTANYLRDTPHQQFQRVSDQKRDAITRDFGSINNFITSVFLESSETYLSLRSNRGSEWRDEEGVSYHFGDNVPNYLKVRPGARFVIERRFDGEGYKIIGVGRIGEVQRMPKEGDGPTSFVASYSEYAAVVPARLIDATAREALLASPGYNQQHSIHTLSAEAFKLLSGEQLVLQEPADPAADLAQLLYWEEPRAKRLLQLALSKRGHQLLFFGPPGTGKTYTAFSLAKVLAPEGFGYIEKVQFHPSYAYEDFIEGIRPGLDAQPESSNKEPSEAELTGEPSGIRYRLVDGVFKEFVKRAQRDPGKRYVFVIDELNRANLASVFGELLYCLEYRGPNHSISLPYSHEKFWLPENLWLIGTMNTADRSIALVDAAFRRRFKHWHLGPDYAVLREWLTQNGYADHAPITVSRLEELNSALLPRLGVDRLIGQSFFMIDDIGSDAFERIWDEDLEPVLHEHFFGVESDLGEFKKMFVGLND